MEGHRDKPSSGTPPEVSIPPLPKHTPEPWEIRERPESDIDPWDDFCSVINHPISDERIFHEPVCMVFKGEHAAANAALIRLSPRMARVLEDIYALAPPPGLLREDSPIVKKFEQIHELLAELEKAGAL